MQKTSGQGGGVLSFLVDITCSNEFSNRSIQYWLLNTSKQIVGKLPGSKVGASHRVTQFFQEELAESMPLWDDQLQRFILMDPSSQ